jgi:hypothetical protein
MLFIKNSIILILKLDISFFQLGFYTNDRLYGLRTLPKRPWESFKDPENTMMRVAYKHNRKHTQYQE